MDGIYSRIDMIYTPKLVLYLQGLESSMLVGPLWPEMPQAFSLLGKLLRIDCQYGGELCSTWVDP